MTAIYKHLFPSHSVKQCFWKTFLRLTVYGFKNVMLSLPVGGWDITSTLSVQRLIFSALLSRLVSITDATYKECRAGNTVPRWPTFEATLCYNVVCIMQKTLRFVKGYIQLIIQCHFCVKWSNNRSHILSTPTSITVRGQKSEWTLMLSEMFLLCSLNSVRKEGDYILYVYVLHWASEELSVSHNLLHTKYILATHPHSRIHTQALQNWSFCSYIHIITSISGYLQKPD